MSDPHRPLKNAFGRFATGVAVASCVNPRGDFTVMTINSFSSVSLSPPLVLWCLQGNAASYDDFMQADHYAVTILHAGQETASNRFARRLEKPLSAGEFDLWKSGAPILKERLAGFDCRVVDRHAAGDHTILIGEVIAFDARPGAPLLYFASRYASGPKAE